MRSALLASICLLALPASAQVRTEPDISSLLEPHSAPAAAELFARDGLFRVAGGVVFAGRTDFLAGHAASEHPVAASAVQLQAEAGAAVLRYAGATYPVRMPSGLACPLARFTNRDGMIAYTVPRFLDEDARRELLHLGIVRHRIAREFDGTAFEPLLRAADFAQTVPLPQTLTQPLLASLNQTNGFSELVILASDQEPKPIGSMLNADVQVRYRAHLDTDRHTLDIGGVPLRYFWQYGSGGAAQVFSVEIFAQSWTSGALSPAGAPPAQVDVVNLYQVGGLFREFHVKDAPAFDEFTRAVCGST